MTMTAAHHSRHMWDELHGLLNSRKQYNNDDDTRISRSNKTDKGVPPLAATRPSPGGATGGRNQDAALSQMQDNLEVLKTKYAKLKRLDVNARNNGNNLNERAELNLNMSKLRKKILAMQARYNTLLLEADNRQAGAGRGGRASRGGGAGAGAGAGTVSVQADKGSSDDTAFIAVNGSEPVFTEQRWSSNIGIKNNNCYSYAMNNFSDDRGFKAVPGDRSGYNHDLSYNKCTPLQKRLLDDNPDSIYKEVPKNKCKEGFSKIMLFVGNQDGNSSYGDFHFFKHHNDLDYVTKKGDTIQSVARFLEVDPGVVMAANNGSPQLRPGTSLLYKNFRTRDGRSVWSHKLGTATGAILNDACGKIITDPRSSCRKFSSIDYTKYCGTYCIRNAIAKSS